VQGGPFHARHELDDTGFSNISDKAVNDLVTQVAMRHLPAFEA
jgi:hypothetical protein